MCAVSVITDYGIRQRVLQEGGITKQEDFLELIRKAQAFDLAHGEPYCESAEKKEWIKQLTDYVKSNSHVSHKVY